MGRELILLLCCETLISSDQLVHTLFVADCDYALDERFFPGWRHDIELLGKMKLPVGVIGSFL